ncbi:CbtB domain-containing protein [Paradesulfitobacterium aromaticivorans]
MMNYANKNVVSHKKFNLNLSLPVQLLSVLALTGLVLFTLLFSTYPPLHDSVHALRHALMIIPCH